MSKPVIFVVFLLLIPCTGFPNLAGNCNGLYGAHLPNSFGGGDGGYVISVSDSVVASNGNRVAKVLIQHLRFMNNVSQTIANNTLGTGFYVGFLLKSYDPYTGLPLGSFQQPLPPYTVFYDGCSPPQSAISHSLTDDDIEQGVQYVTDPPLELLFTWPATMYVSPSLSPHLCFLLKIIYQGCRLPAVSCGGF